MKLQSRESFCVKGIFNGVAVKDRLSKKSVIPRERQRPWESVLLNVMNLIFFQ